MSDFNIAGGAEMTAQSQETKNEGYSARETELIKELVKARMERNSELEYESFEGYEIPPRTQFSMLNKPAVSIKYGTVTFNMACIRMFEGVRFIVTPINSEKKSLLAVCCTEEDYDAVEWARQQKKDNKWVNKDISCLEVCEKIYSLMGWNKSCRYKILGRVVNSPSGIVLRFELSEAIMFAGLPEEFTDPITGEIKKRQVSYYPDKYKGRIGRSYTDYLETKQLSMFETLEGFDGMAGKTYGDAPQNDEIPKEEKPARTTFGMPQYSGIGSIGNGGHYE